MLGSLCRWTNNTVQQTCSNVGRPGRSSSEQARGWEREWGQPLRPTEAELPGGLENMGGGEVTAQCYSR